MDTDVPLSRLEKEGFVTAAHSADDDGTLTVHGVALGEGPANGTVADDVDEEDAPTIYTAEALEKGAEKLVGRYIVDDRDHDPNADEYDPYQPANENIVGEVTDAKYKPGVGIIYEGEVDRNPERELVESGRADVSPTVHRRVRDYDDELGGKPADAISHIRDLAVVPDGGSRDASIDAGPAAEALAKEFDPDSDMGVEAHGSRTTAHTPKFSSTATQNWTLPKMGSFDTDDLSEIDNHFLVSQSGFPPEKYVDLALPVVSPSGTLHREALKRMKTHAAQVTGLSGNTLERVKTEIDNLLEKEFGESETNETEAHARVRDDTKQSESETSVETMAESDNPEEETPPGSDEGGDGENTEEQEPQSELEGKSKEELISMVDSLQSEKTDLRETMSELKGQVKALGGDVESLKANFAPLEDQAVEAFAEKHDHEKEFVREHFDTGDIIDELGGPESAAEALAMTPNPQTGDPDPTGEKDGTVASLGSDEQAEVESLAARAETFDSVDESHAEALREQAADIAGAEDWDEIATEVV